MIDFRSVRTLGWRCPLRAVDGSARLNGFSFGIEHLGLFDLCLSCIDLLTAKDDNGNKKGEKRRGPLLALFVAVRRLPYRLTMESSFSPLLTSLHQC